MHEQMIWERLMEAIGNPCGAAGLMGNLYAESALNPTNLQGKYEKKLGMTDAAYTEAVDNGTYPDFVHDGAGYGLAQWTYWSRKEALLRFARDKGCSIGNLEMQLAYLQKELEGYKTVMQVLRTAKSVREASDVVLTKYERPANQSESVKEKRAAYGQMYLEMFSEKSMHKTDTKEGEHMAYDPKRVINIALSEVGYLEKASNAELDEKYANPGNKNYTKYARDLARIPFFNSSKIGVAWCSVFVSWCFNAAYGEDAARMLLCQPSAKNNCAAGCGSALKYFKAKGQLFDTPKVGDQVFFFSADKSTVSHTGLVYQVDSDYVYTVEGNTSSASGVVANGGAVAKKKYKQGYARFAGFGRPDYGMEASASEPETPATDGRKVVTIVSKNGRSVNLRKGNGTNFGRVDSAASGASFPWVATAENGWHAFVYKQQVVWVSGEYSKVSG